MLNKIKLFLTVAVFLLLPACNAPASTSESIATPATLQELTIHGWDGYMPQSVLDAFTTEYGVAVRYVGYGIPDEAMEAMRKGEGHDLVVLDNLYIALAMDEGLLAELDHRNLSNFQNVEAEFRDLAFDAQNEHSVPYQWGTIGLLYRTDLVEQPVTGWADLWNPVYAGKIALWPYDRDVIGMTLKTLGYSSNSQDSEELTQASERLMELKDKTFFIDTNLDSGVEYLVSGEAQIVVGWPYDIHVAEGYAVEYVVPKEGTFIWMDNLAIPANSPNQATAELFLNFLMRAEISAQIANEMSVAIPNDAARQYIEPAILNNPLIFPKPEDLKHAEFYQPIRPETQARYDEIWQEFSEGY